MGVPVCQAQSRILGLGNQKVCHNTYSSKNMVLEKMWFTGRNDTFWYIQRHPNLLNTGNFPWQIFFQKCRFYGNRPCTRSDGNSAGLLLYSCLPALTPTACSCLPPGLIVGQSWGGGGGVSLNFVRRTKVQIFWTQEALKITHNTNASSVPHCLVSRATNLENPIVFLIYCILISRTFVL